MYGFLGQPVTFSTLSPLRSFSPLEPLRTALPTTEPFYAVKAFRTLSPSGGRWVEMTQYAKYYPDSNYVGAYFDLLCARGRGLAPRVVSESLFGSETKTFPVLVQMLHREGAIWTVTKECRK